MSNLFKRFISTVLSFLFLFGLSFIPIHAANDEIRDKSGRVIYRLEGDKYNGKVFKGRDLVLTIRQPRTCPFITEVTRTDNHSRFDLIDRENTGGSSFSHSSNYFDIRNSGSKVLVMQHGKEFLKFESRLSDWKIAVFVYDKLRREEEAKQVAATEQKALKDAKKARGEYTGELHEAIASFAPVGEIEQMVKDNPDWLGEEDEYHRLPIHIAIMHYRNDCLRTLLDNGADRYVNLPIKYPTKPPEMAGMSPLMLAINYGNSDAVRRLLSCSNLNVNYANPIDNRSALDFARKWKQADTRYSDTRITFSENLSRPELWKELLSHGARIDASGDGGNLHLIGLAADAETELVTTLLDAGVDVNARLDDNYPSALYAVLLTACTNPEKRAEAFKLADILINRGANVDSLNQSGGRCGNLLCFAASSNDKVLAEYLLSKGVRFDCKDSDGKTPLEIATKSFHFEIAKLLRKYSNGSARKRDMLKFFFS